MSKTVAIIQARMGSKRLPGKALLPLWENKTVLEIIVARVCAAKTVDEVVIATTTNKADLLIADTYINKIARYYPKAKLFRGDEDDVLQRVYDTAVSFFADIIIDITADCPLVDPRHIDKIVAEFMTHTTDYYSNVVKRTWPDGLDIQVYSIKSLILIIRSEKYSLQNSVGTLNHDHAGWNIAKSNICTVQNIEAPKKYTHPEWGLTLDEVRDYEVLKHIFSKFVQNGDLLFRVEDVLDYIIMNPKLMNYNKNVKRKVI